MFVECSRGMKRESWLWRLKSMGIYCFCGCTIIRYYVKCLEFLAMWFSTRATQISLEVLNSRTSNEKSRLLNFTNGRFHTDYSVSNNYSFPEGMRRYLENIWSIKFVFFSCSFKLDFFTRLLLDCLVNRSVAYGLNLEKLLRTTRVVPRVVRNTY